MPFDIESLFLFRALLDDKYISFNMDRPLGTISPFPRDVVLLSSPSTGKAIIPGVVCAKEKTLLKELKKARNWKRVKAHSFVEEQKSFSLLWRFSGKIGEAADHVKRPAPLAANSAQRVRSALKKYRSSLQSDLRPGKVFLIPDAEITFKNPARHRQVYARPVLVFTVHWNQVLIIPFSTRIEKMNKTIDILFDSEYAGESLVRDGIPAVENYPYKMFTKKTALFVTAAQPVTREGFLAAALTPLGAVTNNLLHFVKERMKNIPT